MLCKKCGKKLKKNYPFCIHCGEPIPEEDMIALKNESFHSEPLIEKEVKEIKTKLPELKNKVTPFFSKVGNFFNSIGSFFKGLNKKVVAITSLSLVAAIALIIFLLVYPFGKPNVDKIKADLDQKVLTDSNQELYFIEESAISSIKIVHRETSKRKGTDLITLAITFADEVMELSGTVNLQYLLQDGSWVLDPLSLYLDGSLDSMPLTGVNTSTLDQYLPLNTLNVGNSLWTISSEDIKNIEVVSQNTNLEEKKDEIIINVTLDKTYASASGELKLSFIFNENHWMLENMERTKSDDFVVSQQEDFLAIYSEDDIKWDIYWEEIRLSSEKSFYITEDILESFKVESSSIEGSTAKVRVYLSVKDKLFTAAGYLNLTYSIDQFEGWTLNTPIEPQEELTLNITPVSSDKIKEDLIDKSLYTDTTEGWKSISLSPETLTNVSIISREASEDGNSEKIKASIVVEETNGDKKVTYKGTVIFDYYLSGLNWKLNNYTGDGEFSVQKN